MRFREIAPALQVLGIVVTKADARKNYFKQTMETLKEMEGDLSFRILYPCGQLYRMVTGQQRAGCGIRKKQPQRKRIHSIGRGGNGSCQ